MPNCFRVHTNVKFLLFLHPRDCNPGVYHSHTWSTICTMELWSLCALKLLLVAARTLLADPLQFLNSTFMTSSLKCLVPRPLPDFISQLWRKIGRRPGTITTSRTGNGGLDSYVMWTLFHNDGNVPTQYAASTASDRTVKFV